MVRLLIVQLPTRPRPRNPSPPEFWAFRHPRSPDLAKARPHGLIGSCDIASRLVTSGSIAARAESQRWSPLGKGMVLSPTPSLEAMEAGNCFIMLTLGGWRPAFGGKRAVVMTRPRRARPYASQSHTSTAIKLALPQRAEPQESAKPRLPTLSEARPLNSMHAPAEVQRLSRRTISPTTTAPVQWTDFARTT
jgi:hypothetical protein